MSALFACTRCLSRHQFHELSAEKQECRECQGIFPVVKCSYCQMQIRQTNNVCRYPICSNCEAKNKWFGKPTVCKYCNLTAAYFENKCQRCSYLVRKYGPPITCELCNQKCAFGCKDKDKKVCRLCYSSYMRALVKTKLIDDEQQDHLQLIAQRSSEGKYVKDESCSKHPRMVDVMELSQATTGQDGVDVPAPQKAAPAGGNNRKDPLDRNSFHNNIEIFHLKEQIEYLQNQLIEKDNQLLSKEKMITEMKAEHLAMEHELRTKIKSIQRNCDKTTEEIALKITALQKEVATLSNSGKYKRIP